MYFVILIFVVVIAVGVAVLTESRLGKLLRAMGDSPLALETYGLTVNVDPRARVLHLGVHRRVSRAPSPRA